MMIAAALTLSLSLSGAQAVAQAAVSGIVRADSGTRALAGAEIHLEGSALRTTTDAAGRYVLGPVPSGPQILLFRSVGFRPVRHWVSITTGDTLRLDVALKAAGVQELDPLEVRGAPAAPRGIGREAFEERRRLGFGKFIDSSDLRRNEHRRVADLLRMIPGVQIVRFRECESARTCGPLETRLAAGRGRTSITSLMGGGSHCWLTVYRDGALLYRSGSRIPPPDFDRDFRIAELEFIEVYRSAAEVPVEYGGSSAACGVVLLWTRRVP